MREKEGKKRVNKGEGWRGEVREGLIFLPYIVEAVNRSDVGERQLGLLGLVGIGQQR